MIKKLIIFLKGSGNICRDYIGCSGRCSECPFHSQENMAKLIAELEATHETSEKPDLTKRKLELLEVVRAEIMADIRDSGGCTKHLLNLNHVYDELEATQ